jgi:S1-C subfamily serine protease
MKRFLAGVAGGLLGAAVVLGGAFALGAFDGTIVEQTVVKGETVSYEAEGLTPQQIYDEHAEGVVEIVATLPAQYDMFGQSTGPRQGIGTGFVVSDDGYILTNSHVVSESGQLAVDVQVVFNQDGKGTTQVTGTIVGADDATDVALIKIDPSQAPELRVLPLGDSSQVAIGEQVVAIGNPLGLEFSLSSGIVSATDREIQSPDGSTIVNAIQTDTSINPGNSGGPLIDSAGNVIGINEQIASRSGGNDGIGFAVPINTAVQVMEQMKGGSFAQGGYGDQQGEAQLDPTEVW